MHAPSSCTAPRGVHRHIVIARTNDALGLSPSPQQQARPPQPRGPELMHDCTTARLRCLERVLGSLKEGLPAAGRRLLARVDGAGVEVHGAGKSALVRRQHASARTEARGTATG